MLDVTTQQKEFQKPGAVLSIQIVKIFLICVCVCVCVCIHIHTYIYIYIYMLLNLLKNKLKDLIRKLIRDQVRHFKRINFFAFIHSFMGTRLPMACVGVRGQPERVILFFYHAGPGHGIQVLRLGGKHLYPLSHLKSP